MAKKLSLTHTWLYRHGSTGRVTFSDKSDLIWDVTYLLGGLRGGWCAANAEVPALGKGSKPKHLSVFFDWKHSCLKAKKTLLSGFYGDFGNYPTGSDVPFWNNNGHKIKFTIDCHGILFFWRYICGIRNSYRPTHHQAIRLSDVPKYDRPSHHETIKPSISQNRTDHKKIAPSIHRTMRRSDHQCPKIRQSISLMAFYTSCSLQFIQITFLSFLEKPLFVAIRPKLLLRHKTSIIIIIAWLPTALSESMLLITISKVFWGKKEKTFGFHFYYMDRSMSAAKVIYFWYRKVGSLMCKK